ncbi:hypothetical protein [Gemmatimonas sp.]|uniref:hypothetical protein n=1 Tax=Gemmatimonas sp. TaxID=1962908 RepID=UPI0035656813
MKISMSMSRTKSAAWTIAGVSILAATTSTASAQVAPEAPSTSTVPVREVTAPLAKATRAIGGANMLRALPDGSIFVNDVQRRQLLRFDPTLQNVVVVADTAPGALMPYGQRPIGLLPYLGDSTIVVDPATMSLVVLNKDGKTVRVMASPRTNDVNTLSNMNLGSHAFDQKGRLYYRQGSAGGAPGGGGMAMMFGSGNDRGGGGRGGQGGGQGGNNQQARGGAQAARPAGDDPALNNRGGGQPFGGPGGRGFNPQNQPDSVPIVRVDFDTRKADTVTYVKVPKNETQMTRGEDGSTKITIKINPLPQADDWALLNDGTVAVMRVLDFHVDYYRPDGSHVASDRLPFDWKRITDDDRTKLVDSLQGLAKAANDRAGANGGGGGFRMSFEPVAAEKLPDYYPPIRAGTTLADFDGNLWVLPATSNLSAQIAAQFMGGMGGRGGPGGFGGPGGAPGAPRAAGGAAGAAANASGAPRAAGDTTRGGMPAAAMGMMAAMMNQPPLVYDIISPAGTMIERVKLPAGRQLIGFGPNGAIFLGARDGRQIIVEKVTRKE